MRSRFFPFTLTGLLLLSYPNPCSAGHEIGNGGGGVTVAGRLRFLDQVQSACNYTPFVDFAREHSPEYFEIVESIKRLHWVHGAVLELLATQLRICEIAQPLPVHLIPLQAPTTESLFRQIVNRDRSRLQGRARHRVIALRISEGNQFDNTVFLDSRRVGNRTVFHSLPQMDRAILLLHELSHELFPTSLTPASRSLRLVDLSALTLRVHQQNLSLMDFQRGLDAILGTNYPLQELDALRSLYERTQNLQVRLRNLSPAELRQEAFRGLRPDGLGLAALHLAEQNHQSPYTTRVWRAIAPLFLTLTRLGFDTEIADILEGCANDAPLRLTQLSQDWLRWMQPLAFAIPQLRNLNDNPDLNPNALMAVASHQRRGGSPTGSPLPWLNRCGEAFLQNLVTNAGNGHGWMVIPPPTPPQR